MLTMCMVVNKWYIVLVCINLNRKTLLGLVPQSAMRLTEIPTQLLIKNKLTTLLMSFVLINPALFQILPQTELYKTSEEEAVEMHTELKNNVLAILKEDGQRDINQQGYEQVFELLVKKVDKESLLELVPVAYCESSFNQRGQNTNRDSSKDNGMFQINNKYHSGVDVSTVEKNVDYAIKLYNANRLSDWRASKYCWSPVTAKLKSTLI